MENPLLKIKKESTDDASTNLLEIALQNEFLNVPKDVGNNNIETKQADRTHLEDMEYRIQEDENHVCGLCDKVFLLPEDLEKHRRRFHVKAHSYFCNLCSFKSNLLSSFEKHIRSHSEQNLSVISISKDAPYIYEHLYKSFYCKLCKFKCNEQSAIIIHCNRFHLDIKHQQCGLCGEKLDNCVTLDNHKCTHTGEKGYKCNKQAGQSVHGKKVDTLSDQIMNDGDCLYYCNLCSFKSDVLNSCKDHIRSHSEQNLIIISITKDAPYVYEYQGFQCKLCKYKCMNQPAIIRHVNEPHLEIKNQQCDLCGETFDNLAILDDHKCIHTGEKLYKCNKQAGLSNDLNLTDSSEVIKQEEHLLLNKLRKRLQDKLGGIHGDSKSVCQQCVEVFSYPEDLEIHVQRVHDKKVDTLSECSETSFIHQIIDNSNNTYYCNVCSFKSDMLSCCNDHMKSHSEKNLIVISISKDAPYIYRFLRFQCKLCKFKCVNQPTMIKHVEKPHFEIKTQQCALCGEKFDNLASFDIHNCTHTSEKHYNCTKEEGLSNDLNSTDTDLLDVTKQEEYLILDEPEIKVKGRVLKQSKMKTKHAEKSVEMTNEANYVVVNKMYLCTICPFGTKVFTEIQLHFKSHDISVLKRCGYDTVSKEMCNKLKDYLYQFCDTFYQCKVCDFKSPEHDLIQQHVDNFHINVTSRCEVCNTFFESSTVLTLHNDDRITKQYKCLTCEYTSFEPLAKHMEIHPNKCFHCDVRRSKPLTKQMDDCTTNSIYYCSLCSRKFSIMISWQKHNTKFHPNENPRAIPIVKDAQYVFIYKKQSFQCKLCQFNCSKQSIMRPHVKRVHLKIKNYQCELCGKRFYNSTSLNRHMRFHTGEKPYKCTECDYTSSVSLSKHMKIHNEVKPFHCNVCEYKSPDPARLRVHMRTHTGEKPYKCFICDYAATHKVSLVNHMKKKHTN